MVTLDIALWRHPCNTDSELGGGQGAAVYTNGEIDGSFKLFILGPHNLKVALQ